MSAENSHFTRYQAVVEEAQKHTYAGLKDELITTDATIQLVLAALTAFEHGLSREEIITALIEGEAQGLTLYHNMQAVPDRHYWQEVKAEAERYWSARSSSD